MPSSVLIACGVRSCRDELANHASGVRRSTFRHDEPVQRCQRYGSDIFKARLILRRVVCVSGPEAASVFYAPDRLTRRGALPPTSLTLLQDKPSAVLLDGRHRHRQEMFLRLTRPGHFDRLG
jgi:fatty-acid peroxygenase